MIFKAGRIAGRLEKQRGAAPCFPALWRALVCTHVCMYVCKTMYVCMYVCMYVLRLGKRFEYSNLHSFAAYSKLNFSLRSHAHFNVCTCALVQSKRVVNNVGMFHKS